MECVQVEMDEFCIPKILIGYSFYKYVPGSILYPGDVLSMKGHFLMYPVA